MGKVTLPAKTVQRNARLKGGVERISTFLNKAHQGIQLCLGDSEKIITKIVVLV